MNLKVITAVCIFAVGTALANTTAIMVSLWNPAQLPPAEYDVMGLRLSAIYGKCSVFTGLDIGLVQKTARDFAGIGIGGILNNVNGRTFGAQVGGVGNVAGDVYGTQIGGLFNASDSMSGVQCGYINWAEGEVKGVQIGDCNCACRVDSCGISFFDLYGVQIGLGNVARDVYGVQIGEINVVGIDKMTKANTGLGYGCYGAQIGILGNGAFSAMHGVQIGGLSNYAGILNGVQIGLFNFAATVDGGIQIGLWNHIEKNGWARNLPIVNGGF